MNAPFIMPPPVEVSLSLMENGERFVEAHMLGALVDAVFRSRCEVLGVLPEEIGWDVELLALCGIERELAQ